MKLTAEDLKGLGVIERVIPEPEDFSDTNMDAVCADIDQGITEFIEKYSKLDGRELTEKRYRRFRRM